VCRHDECRGRVRTDLADLAPYQSPQRPARYRLNTNESPYPPPRDLMDEAFDEVRAATLNRYPDHAAGALLEALSSHTSWPVEGLSAGNGSNEVLLHLFLAFGGPGRRAMVFEPTYSLHKTIPQITGTRVVTAPRTDDFRIDPVSALRSIGEVAPEIVVMCSPNNPTGNCEDPDTVEALLARAPGLVIVDEAYVEFAGRGRDLQRLLPEYTNLVIVKTLSKAWRLAGVRLGYMLAHPAITSQVARVRLPYHLSTFSQAIGVAALQHADHALEHIRAITQERDRIGRTLADSNIKCFESHANFVLFRVAEAHKVWSSLLDQGVLVRDYSATPGLEECLRVTAGTSEETDAFLEAARTAIKNV
jgi:histidinol-phosphate aminotransferase